MSPAPVVRSGAPCRVALRRVVSYCVVSYRIEEERKRVGDSDGEPEIVRTLLQSVVVVGFGGEKNPSGKQLLSGSFVLV
jgi:hypothetical protein